MSPKCRKTCGNLRNYCTHRAPVSGPGRWECIMYMEKSCFWFQLFVSMLQIFSIKKNSSESYLSGQNHVNCLLHYSDATTQLITPCVVLAISSVEYISTFCFKKNKNFLAQKAKKKSVWRVSLKQEISFKENSFKVRNIFK